MQNYPALWPVFQHLTDWQIIHLLGDGEKKGGEVVPYDELFYQVWSDRGYTDSQVEQIWQWRMVQGLDDEQTWAKIQEAGYAR